MKQMDKYNRLNLLLTSNNERKNKSKKSEEIED